MVRFFLRDVDKGYNDTIYVFVTRDGQSFYLHRTEGIGTCGFALEYLEREVLSGTAKEITIERARKLCANANQR